MYDKVLAVFNSKDKIAYVKKLETITTIFGKTINTYKACYEKRI